MIGRGDGAAACGQRRDLRLRGGGRHRVRRAWPATAVVAVALGGCGGGDRGSEADGPSTALHITRDFGHTALWANDRVPLDGRETLLRQLRDEHKVELRFDGMLMEAIDGRRSDFHGAAPTAWLTYVNGMETDIRAADYRIHDGDVVQWDLRAWFVSPAIRATVGAFPQTFTRGVFGRTFPVEVTCARPASAPCQQVKQTLRAAGVRPDGSRPAGPPPPAGSTQRASVLVGEWRDLLPHRWARRFDAGLRYSGIFARFAPDARSLRLLSWNGRTVRTAGAGTGLVAAMRPTEEDLAWFITGVDAAGVGRAAGSLRPAALRDATAVAITADGVEKLPLPPARR